MIVNNVKVVKSWFPSKYSDDIDGIFNLLEYDKHAYHSDAIPICTGEEIIFLPCRIYYHEILDEQLVKLNETQKRLIYTLYTRHNNGFLREKYLRKIFEDNSNELDTYMIPYIIALSSEYVVEIIEVILRNIKLIKRDRLSKFIACNSKYILTIEGRISSYWGEYYQNIPKKDYCGYKLQRLYKEVRKEVDSMIKQPNLYNKGDQVSVVLNKRNSTRYRGIIRDVIWHFKDECWLYFIEVNGKKISKRYYEDDLQLI